MSAGRPNRAVEYNRSPRGKAIRWKHQDERCRRFREFLAKAKNAPCADCGGRFPPVCMDFDHRPGTEKRYSVSGMTSARIELVVAEIAKCDLVCANCHRIRTAERNVQREYWQRRREAGKTAPDEKQLALPEKA